MALKWVNIRSGEHAVADTEPQIAALWASSDHSPNVTQGQDFGWRLAPEVVVEMKKIKQDLQMLTHIASRIGKLVEDVGEVDVLHYISNKTKLDEAPQPELNQFEDEYDAQIRALEGKPDRPAEGLPAREEEVTTTTTTEQPVDVTTTTTTENV